MNNDTRKFVQGIGWLSKLGKEAWFRTLKDIQDLPEVPVNSR